MDDDVRAPTDARRRPERPRLSRPRSWSLATQLFAFQAVVILVVLLGAGVAAFSNAAAANADSAEDEVLGVARTLELPPGKGEQPPVIARDQLRPAGFVAGGDLFQEVAVGFGGFGHSGG